MALVTAAYWLAYYFRFDGDVPGRYERLFVGTVGIVIGVKLVVFVAMRFYTKWWRFTSLRDLQAILLATAGSSLILAALLSTLAPGRPRARAARRPGLRPPADPRPDRGRLRGAQRDRAAAALRAREQRQGGADLRRGRRRQHPAARDEAEPRARLHARRPHRRRPPGSAGCACRAPACAAPAPTCRGCCARCTSTRSSSPCRPRRGACARRSSRACRAAGVQCTTLPGLPELITGEVTVSQLREVRVEDVLGRAAIEIDFARVAGYLTGRPVLVTGAGGSIGPELCRQVRPPAPPPGDGRLDRRTTSSRSTSSCASAATPGRWSR